MPVVFRTMWEDWGLAARLRDQAKRFLQLAREVDDAGVQEGYVRASMVFSVMSFEAFFFREIIVGCIQQHAATLDATNVAKIENGLHGKHGSFTGICKALRTWPSLLGLKTLDPASTEYFNKLLEYRNALTHGDIIRSLPHWGDRLAQEVETLAEAELALDKIGELIKEVAQHFRLTPPVWV